MTYLTDRAQSRFQQAFFENNMTLNIRPDCIVAENSHAYTKEKIQEIIDSVGFCPLISENKIDGNFAFTVVPYKIPDFFKQSTPVDHSELASSIVKSSLDFKAVEKEKGLYFTKDELLKLLERQKFIRTDEFKPEDDWWAINGYRSSVSTPLNKGLSEVISKHVKDGHPIIEFGSGIGYTLSDSLSSKTIRTQPRQAECQSLSKSISEPIYQTDIEGIYKCLLESGKKIPLFFALNVFDTLSSSLRKTSFSQISQLQNSGDRILIMLDANPYLDAIIGHLESLYPKHVIFPFFPLTKDPCKFSVIIVPIEYAQHKPTQSQFDEMISQGAMTIINGRVSQTQCRLHQLQKKFGLKVIVLEDFFAKQVKDELVQVGYQADVYYHASFTTEDPPKGLPKIKQDLIYKPVTDTATVRQWCLTDETFLNSLSKKGLALPNHFNGEFLFSLRERGKKYLEQKFL